MDAVIDVDEVVLKEVAEQESFEEKNEKPLLGSSVATAYVLPHVDGKLTSLQCFDPSTLANLEPSNWSALLAAAGLDQFVDIISKWNDVNVDSVESFVLSYSASERRSSVRGRWVPVTTDSIGSIFKLPESGASLSTLRSDEAFVVTDCFSSQYSLSDSDSSDIQIAHLSPNWKPWVQLVQVYLQIQPNEDIVDQGTLRAAVAIRQGVRINWALPLSRRIHKCLLDFKACPGELQCASHIFTLVEALCPQYALKPMEPKTDPESSSSSKPSVVDPVSSQLLLSQFQTWLSAGGNASHTAEFEAAKKANEELKTELENCRIELENYRSQLEKQCHRTQNAEVEGSRLKADVQHLQQKSMSDADHFGHLERKYYMEKGLRKKFEEFKDSIEDEVSTLRQFYSDFSYLRNNDDSDLQDASAVEAAISEAEFVANEPKSVSFSALEELQDIVPATCSLEDAYHWEREVFFLRMGLTYKESVSELQFQFLWKKACLLRTENLFTEVLGRGDVVLENAAAAYFVIGDYGARVLKFYADLEATLAWRRETAVLGAGNQRTVQGHRLSTGVDEDLPKWDAVPHEEGISQFAEWQQRVLLLQGQFASDAWMHELVKNCQVRTTTGHVIDVHPAAYLKCYHITKARLQAKLAAKSVLELPQVNVEAELVLQKPQLNEQVDPLSGTSTNLGTWMLPTPFSMQALDDHYLGMWPHLFSGSAEESFPTWEAIAWIGKDHTHIDRSPLVPLGRSEKLNKLRRSLVPPKSVRDDAKYYDCPRRYSWTADAKLDSVFYNWPIIPGDFETPQLCTENYSRFSEMHRFHEDPVCFRASIFAAILAFWCSDMGITVDYRVGARFSTDIYIFNSIQYHSTRRIRMLELMCQMQFLRDAHDIMIEDSFEEIGTRRSPSFLCVEKHDFFSLQRRRLGAELKAEEAIHVNAYTAELARVKGKGKQTQSEDMETE